MNKEYGVFYVTDDGEWSGPLDIFIDEDEAQCRANIYWNNNPEDREHGDFIVAEL